MPEMLLIRSAEPAWTVAARLLDGRHGGNQHVVGGAPPGAGSAGRVGGLGMAGGDWPVGGGEAGGMLRRWTGAETGPSTGQMADTFVVACFACASCSDTGQIVTSG